MSETMNLTKEQTERVLCKFLEQENGLNKVKHSIWRRFMDGR